MAMEQSHAYMLHKFLSLGVYVWGPDYTFQGRLSICSSIFPFLFLSLSSLCPLICAPWTYEEFTAKSSIDFKSRPQGLGVLILFGKILEG